MSKKNPKGIKPGDKVMDSADRAGRVLSVREDGSCEVDMYSQYWDYSDRVTLCTNVKELRRFTTE